MQFLCRLILPANTAIHNRELNNSRDKIGAIKRVKGKISVKDIYCAYPTVLLT